MCLVAQLCPILCDSIDCSLTGSSVYGILQARILEWAAISFSRGSSRPRNGTGVSWKSLALQAPGDSLYNIESDQIRSDQSLSRVRLFATP